MLIGGIIAGLVIGLAVGGSLSNLSQVRLRWISLLFLAVVIRFATEWAIGAGIDIAQTLRLPLFGLSFGLLLVGLWANRDQPGLSLAFIGILLNAIAVVVNGGYMPIWRPSLVAAGFDPDTVFSVFHKILESDELDASFLLAAGPIGDILPIPVPFIRNVASIGDLFLTAGLGFFLFATVLRSPAQAEAEDAPRAPGVAGVSLLSRGVKATDLGRRVRPSTGLASGLSEASTLDQAMVLGSRGAGLSAPSASAALTPVWEVDASVGEVERELQEPDFEVAARIRRHPYVRLALNSSFSALWAGQLISLFGDRVNQIALAFLVLAVTGSPVAVAFVFVAATLPNLFLSPIAGTYVDRWDQKDVMVVSDLLRAAIILIIPIAAVTNILIVYPLVFAITSVSIFFRPARVAALPRIVREDELLTANSAMWIGETIADVIGYPLAAIFVGFLGSALPLAFWLDAATYAASAALIATIVVPPLPNAQRSEERPTVLADLKAGYRFLRNETVLLANTLQATVGQFTIGALTALTPYYAVGIASGHAVSGQTAYGFLETAIGVGNLIGGFVIGVIGTHLARGRTVIAGYTVWGLCVALLAVTGNLPIALGLMFGSGVANMIFIIPSQTMFQERTPPEMLGRVVGFRFALVFGSMTIAMAVSGLLAEVAGVGMVLGVFGIMTMLAGLAGLFIPAVRDA
ncbi:MAG TPA: MFS transporter [Candidatus Limnocylindrales bacterium]|nr:MFS transporter [Candidatus Limnocylindrales bacterium]